MPDWRHAGLTDTRHSPHAALSGLSLREVTLGDGFWKPRLERNRSASLPRLYQLLREHGAVDNLQRLAGLDVPRRGLRWTDSDLAKWLEGASLVLHTTDDRELRAMVDEAAAAFAGAQKADGYLNSYFVDERADQRLTKLDSDHELYCAGHFFQSAVAHHRIAGDRLLLDPAVRYADYIDSVFGPGKLELADGHPEIELALAELYRATGERRYLELVGFFLDRVPLRELREIEGHAVRALYFNCGGADYAAETGDPGTREALDRLWADLLASKVYVTGGVGGRYGGESIGKPYELPHQRAYAETCAAIGLAFLSWRMLQLEPRVEYADALELALYNGFLAGVSLSGTDYFYVNPLAADGRGEGDPWYPWARRGPHQRVPWFDCTCCPTNAVRVFPSLPGWLYGRAGDGLYVHLYEPSSLDTTLADGRRVALSVAGGYPFDGHVQLEIRAAEGGPFALYLRLPGWAAGAAVKVNNVSIDGGRPGEYLRLERAWRPGDTVELTLNMAVTPLFAAQRNRESHGQIALRRGPLIYCLESPDNPFAEVLDLWLDPDGEYRVERRPELLDGVTVIHTTALRQVEPGPLYTPVHPRRGVRFEPVTATLIPYYAWANRGPSAMTVWAPYPVR